MESSKSKYQEEPAVKSYPDYCYVDTAMGDVRHRNKVIDIGELALPTPPWECYVSMFRFGQEYRDHFRSHGSVKDCPDIPYYCDHLWFDIDNEDLDKALEYAKALLIRLESKYGLDLTISQIYFSGSKGYHIGIPAQLFGVIPDSQNAAKFKVMARQLAGDIPFDASIYERNRLWRVSGSINSKSGLYKTPLTFEELAKMDTDEIKKLAASKRDFQQPFLNDIQPDEKLVAIYQNALSGKAILKPQKTGINQTVVKDKACINKLFEGVGAGTRNQAAFRLADHLKKQGIAQEEAGVRLIEWNAKNRPPMNDSEVIRSVESAYAGNYDYGCNDPLLELLCDKKCPLYKDSVKLYAFKFSDSANSEKNAEICMTTDILAESLISELPVFMVERCQEQLHRLPLAVTGAERVYLLSASPEDWFDLAEIIGEPVRIVQVDKTQTVKLSLSNIRESAFGYVDFRIDRILKLPKHQHLDELKKLLPFINHTDAFHLPVYKERIAKSFKYSKKVVQDLLNQSENEEYLSSITLDPQEPEFTDEEWVQAEDLLNSKDLLDRFIADTEKLGCVGEDDNKLTIFLALTSRLLGDPIHLIVKGESSGGKSFQVQTVARFFPEGDILEFTAITPKALYHRKDDLKNKGLVVYERPGAEESDYTIRTLQSEKKLILSTVVKNPQTNEQETQDITVEGPIAYIETTTQSQLNIENETRCFELYIDESEEQTKRIFAAQNQKYQETKPSNEGFLRIWQALQRHLKPVKITIPFVDLIQFPTKPVRVRRDHHRFLTLIQVSAFLHQKQRQWIREDNAETIEASLQDYEIAYRLAGRILSQTIKAISPATEQLIAAACILQKEKGEEASFTTTEISDCLDWSRSKTGRCLKEATNAGYLELVEAQRGKPNQYKFKRSPDENNGILLSYDEMALKIQDRTNRQGVHLSTGVQNAMNRLI